MQTEKKCDTCKHLLDGPHASLCAELRACRNAVAELLNDALGRSPAGTVSVKAPSLTTAIRVMNLAGVEALVRASGMYGQACVTCEGTGHMKDGATAFDSETCMVCGGWGRVDLTQRDVP